MGSVKIDVKIKESEEYVIVTGDCEVKDLTSKAIGMFFADTIISMQKDGKLTEAGYCQCCSVVEGALRAHAKDMVGKLALNCASNETVH